MAKKKDVQKEVKETMKKVSKKLEVVKDAEVVNNEEIFLTIEEKFKLEYHLEKIKSSKVERECSEQKLMVKKLALENFKLQMNSRMKQYEEDINKSIEEIEGRKKIEEKVKTEYVKEVTNPLRKKYGLGEHFSFDPISGQVIVMKEEKKK